MLGSSSTGKQINLKTKQFILTFLFKKNMPWGNVIVDIEIYKEFELKKK
jgi:hypothetical protein